MSETAKKTRAERLAEKAAKEAARKQAIELLKKTAFTPPPLACVGRRIAHASMGQAGATVPEAIRDAASEGRSPERCCGSLVGN